jgi:hypothetical protein
MKHAALLLLAATAACGGADFEVGSSFSDAGLASHVEAGHDAHADAQADAQLLQEASGDTGAGGETASADGGSEKDAGVEASAQEASADAPLETQAQDAAAQEAATCTPLGHYDGTASFDMGYPCGNGEVLLPDHFAYEGPGFACGWQTTPSQCSKCAETYNCACLQAAQPCLTFGQAWKGCVEGQGVNAPVVSCK